MTLGVPEAYCIWDLKNPQIVILLFCTEIFSLICICRNTNANWRGWPRSGRSCVPVWTIFQGGSTILETDIGPLTRYLTNLLRKYLTLSYRCFTNDSAIAVCCWFWTVCVPLSCILAFIILSAADCVAFIRRSVFFFNLRSVHYN